MRAGWESKPLGDVLVKTETCNPTLKPEAEFEYIDVSSVSNRTFEIESTQRLKGREAPSRARRLVRAGDVLLATIRPTLRRIAVVPTELDRQVCSTGYFVMRPRAQVIHRFLMHWLFTGPFMDSMAALQKGASYPAVTDAEVRAQPFSFPALGEQRRIVAILDEAFEGIATAKANAEKNLQNARTLPGEVVRSELQATCKGWARTLVGDQVTLQRGFDITKDQQRPGRVPVVSSSGIKSLHDTPMVRAPGVVMGRKGTLGKVFYLHADFWPHDTTLWVKDFKGNEPRFVFHFFSVLEVQWLDSGAANPALNRNQVHALPVAWPPQVEQRAIADRCDEVTLQAAQLANVYERKLAALDELKKSLLDQAFSGAL